MSVGFRRTAPGAVPAPRRRSRRCGALAGLAAISLLAGCERTGFGRVAVYRPSPDTLLVAVEPARGMFGRARVPGMLTLTASDARGFVLAERRVQPAERGVWPLPIPDSLLASRARLMVEVCGRFAARSAPGGGLVCEQRPVRATPKRARASARLAYPLAGDRERAAARVAVAFERHDGTRWAPLQRPAGLTYALRAWVEGAPRDAVTVPLSPKRDTVRLTGDAGYDAFWLRLNERVFYGEGARVHLAVLARWPDGEEAAVAHAVRLVRPPTQRERQVAVERYARRAARLVARTLGVPLDSASARVEAWQFDRIRQRYGLTVAFALRDSAGVAIPPLRGRLDVGEAGQGGVFREVVLDSSRVPLLLRLGRL